MKRPTLGVWGPLRTTELKFPPKCLGFLTGHRWDAPTVVTEKCIDFFKLNLTCCVSDICQ
jgi:hypothetical protein